MAKTVIKITALLLTSALLTSCGSGQNAVTRNFKQVTDGVEGQSNEVRLRHVLIVKTANGDGVLVATLVNTSDEQDVLSGITIDSNPAEAKFLSSDLIKNKPIIFTGDSANADAYVTNLVKSPGQRIPVTFTFEKAEPVVLDALIIDDSGDYVGMKRYL